MANLFDYLDWRDLKLEQVGFNEIDNLILARLSYFPLDGLIKEREEVPLKEVYQRYQTMGTTGRILQKEDIDLFPILANSIRFGEMKLTKFINRFDPVQEKQFSAVTILLQDRTVYAAYRGTDSTIIGWKEDFNMSFSKTVPAQIEAVSYLEEVARKYRRMIRVGGHSKGGNLAVYAATFCKASIQKRILQIYNNDGPGFCDEVIHSQNYANIISRVHTYIPQTSIIGRLLNHKEKTTILKSTQTGIMQHDLYTWQVLGGKFVKDELTNSSELIDKTITTWLKEVDPKQRETFIDILFDILNATQAKTLSEISNKWYTNAKTMMKTYQKLDEESKKIMTMTFDALLKIGASNITIKGPKRLKEKEK